MKITIITINLNNASGLRRTLASIAEQVKAFNNDIELEHIIVDGESTDNSLCELRNDIPSKVLTTPAAGVYNAINIGLKSSTGQIIGLLHSGDVFALPTTLKNIVDTFISNPNIDYLYGDVTIGMRYYKGLYLSLQTLKEGYAPPHPSLFITRMTLMRIGLYKESYIIASDFDYFIRLAKSDFLKGVYLPTPIVNMEPKGLSNRLFNRLFINRKEKLQVLQSHDLGTQDFHIISHYKRVLKGFLCSSKKK